MQVLIDNFDRLLEAFWLTLRLTVVAGGLSLVFGTVLAAMRVGPIAVLSRAAATYVTIFRNTPLLVLLLLVVFGFPKLDIQLGYFWMNILALGQAEAARSIGLGFTQTMRHVVLPQSFRAVVPPLANVMIALTKNSSLCSIFGMAEGTAIGKALINDNGSQLWWIFFGVALGYVVIVEAISAVSAAFERRWRIA